MEEKNEQLKTENHFLLQQLKEMQIKSCIAEERIVTLQDNIVNVQSAALALAQAFTLEIERLKEVFNSENKTDSLNTEKMLSDGLRLEVLKGSERSISLRQRAFTAEQKIVMLEGNIACAVAKAQVFDTEIERLKAVSKNAKLENENLVTKSGKLVLENQLLVNASDSLRIEIKKATEQSVNLKLRAVILQDNMTNFQTNALVESQTSNIEIERLKNADSKNEILIARIGKRSIDLMIKNQLLRDQEESLRREIMVRSAKAEQNNLALQDNIANVQTVSLAESKALNAEVERLKAISKITDLKNEELLSYSGNQYIKLMSQNQQLELEILKITDLVTALQLEVDSTKQNYIYSPRKHR